MDIFEILDPDPHENLCESETLITLIAGLELGRNVITESFPFRESVTAAIKYLLIYENQY